MSLMTLNVLLSPRYTGDTKMNALAKSAAFHQGLHCNSLLRDKRDLRR